MDDKKRKSLTIKTVFGIGIPLLIMVVTIVMVGASFAWFSDSVEVNISTITLETERAYTVDFSIGNSDLWSNTPYAGQTAIAKDGEIISKTKASLSPGNASNIAFSFVNVIALDTLGKDIDFSMSFSGAKVYRTETTEGGQNEIVKRDYKNDVENISYGFTWMFRKHTSGVANFVKQNGKDKYVAPTPSSTQDEKEVWYTPYGALTFDEDGYVCKVNGIDIDETFGIADAERKIASFNANNQLYDFYVIFAPEELYWSQFFKGDLAYNNTTGKYEDKYTIDTLYVQNGVDKSLITGDYNNQMYYSGMDYQGATFEFSAIINVLKLDETEEA